MGVHANLPFKVGQLVESRSFQPGYRGAWFRSKIKAIVKRRHGQLGCDLEFLDFPGEKYTWTKLYQKSPGYEKKLKHQNDKQSELMVRPSFPLVYRESEMPDVNTISEVIVVVNDVWKVGDLIDWRKDGCYWSGSITKILEKDKFQIDLLPPPLGEGISYKARSKDFRPSLDWSLERGWTVPTPTDSDNDRCARIVNPVKQGKVPSRLARNAGDRKKKVEDTVRASGSSCTSHDSSGSPQSRDQLKNAARKVKRAAETNALLGMENDRTAKRSRGRTDSSSRIKTKSSEVCDEASVGKEGLGDGIAGASESPIVTHDSSSSLPQPRRKKKHDENRRLSGVADGVKTSGDSSSQDISGSSAMCTEAFVRKDVSNDGKGICSGCNSRLDKAGSAEIGETLLAKDGVEIDRKMSMNSMFSDTAEASVLDLEELLQRVKWMKGMLQKGNASSNTTKPPWKFL